MKIRKDDKLGPIFNSYIAEDNRGAHFDTLSDFWETNLFGVVNFKGNPTQKHINVDKNLNPTWLSLIKKRFFFAFFLDHNFSKHLSGNDS